jgi:4-alpha-glucanotransferase
MTRKPRAAARGGTAPDEVPLPGFIRFGRAVCGDLGEAERREWWLADGLGGYAAGTIAGTLTRRYHGLLIAPAVPPLGRRLLLAKADATLLDGADAWPLFSNRWGSGAIAPAGHLGIESFHLDGSTPVWRFAAGPWRIEQRIWMEDRENTTWIAWRLLPDPTLPDRSLGLRIALLANGRDHHGTTDRGWFRPDTAIEGDRMTVAQGGIAMTLTAPTGRIEPRRAWVEDFDLPVERERGLGDRDSHLLLADAVLDLQPGRWVGVVASTAPEPGRDLAAALERRRQRDLALLSGAAHAPDWIRQLVLAADAFIVARRRPGGLQGRSVIAGYPWFGEWGRDAMIALPGLTLATGRWASALAILYTFTELLDGGMLPNLLPEGGQTPLYNSADATLWLIEAWRAYVEAGGQEAALAAAFPKLADVIDRYCRGARHGIGLDEADGLLRAGESGIQLTWMDAKVGDWVVTPRMGKPVEVNALWYNALCAMAGFAVRLGFDAAPWRCLAARARAGFARFVDPAGGGLIDVLDGPGGPDRSVRPNQILAVSLAHSPLPPAVQAAVVRVVGEQLLTSYGLRSLSPADPAFRPVLAGGVRERDGAYHQGTAWAWLLGHFALAEHRVHGDREAALARLAVVRDHLLDAGLGTVSEIFDGAPPHTPRGCPAQAWSVACILEAWWRIDGKDDPPPRHQDTKKVF